MNTAFAPSKSRSPGLALLARAKGHGDRIAIRSDGADHSYADLLRYSAAIAAALLAGAPDLDEARIAFLAPAGFEYVAMQWAIWRAGGIAVPLSVSATLPELTYVLEDSGARTILTTRAQVEKLPEEARQTGVLLFEEIDPAATCDLPVIDESRRAMILYTSGTTSQPKGVVSTHANLRAQTETLVEAWAWSADDRIPLFLPMHHIHGIVNIACCALWSGARIDAYPRFRESEILDEVADGSYTVFMAVPTIYAKILESLDARAHPDDVRARILQGFSAMRLMVSGSAALPARIHEKWTALTGQSLLERYGMTETGMILSNPYHGERRPGAVGQPLPSVQVRLRSENGGIITEEGEPGEVLVKGPMVFREYWNKPDATAEAFDDGWFCTGDMAVLEDGYYRILGRLSVDIIKSGGYKLSALEIESAVLEHPHIRECAVVGVADEKWGEIVAVAVTLESEDRPLALDELRDWSLERLSPYKIPRQLLVLDSLPRNAMGKVQKNLLSRILAEHPSTAR